MKVNEFSEKIENAFKEKLKEQISNEGQLMISGKALKIERISWLTATLQSGSTNLNQLLVEDTGANVNFAGVIEIYPNGEGDDMKPSEIYSFEAVGIRVNFNTEKRKFEFESEITLCNFNKR